MKIGPIVILSFATSVAFPQMTGAKLSMTPQSLGFIESTLDYCAKADVKSAAKYKERGKTFVGAATKEELEKARGSSEYKESYASTTSDLDKVPKDKIVKSCTDFLAGK
jgi:hypothetical protein